VRTIQISVSHAQGLRAVYLPITPQAIGSTETLDKSLAPRLPEESKPPPSHIAAKSSRNNSPTNDRMLEGDLPPGGRQRSRGSPPAEGRPPDPTADNQRSWLPKGWLVKCYPAALPSECVYDWATLIQNPPHTYARSISDGRCRRCGWV
jgi:hypothetical protein